MTDICWDNQIWTDTKGFRDPYATVTSYPNKMRENLRATDWNNLGWLQGLHYDLVILHFCCVAPYEFLRNSTPFSRLAEYFESDYIHSVTRDTVKLTLLTTKWPVLAYIFKLKDIWHQSKDKHQNYIEETDVLTIELFYVSRLRESNPRVLIGSWLQVRRSRPLCQAGINSKIKIKSNFKIESSWNWTKYPMIINRVLYQMS